MHDPCREGARTYVASVEDGLNGSRTRSRTRTTGARSDDRVPQRAPREETRRDARRRNETPHGGNDIGHAPEDRGVRS